MSQHERLNAKCARLLPIHLDARRSVLTASRLPGIALAIAVVKARIEALQLRRAA